MFISTTFRVMRPIFLLGLAGIFFILLPSALIAQSTYIQDGFNGGCNSCSSTYFTATTSGTPDYYGMSTAATNTGCPSAVAYSTEGANAYHVRNGNVTLTSGNLNLCQASNIALSFKLAAYSNTNTEGMDNTDYVEVSISIDGGATYFPTLRITGNSNAKWLYTATGIASTSYDGDGTAVVVGSSAGNTSCSLLSDGISTVQITNLPNVANMRIRIQMVNNSSDERWLIDNFRLTTATAQPSYCSPTFSSGVEPITNVTFAGINNTTTNVIGGSSLESFCSTGTVTQGATHAISLKGNTGGSYTNYFQVYIDWNQNGVLGNAGESTNIGTIANSTGIDATTLTGNISVPAGASLGYTRMRVVKKYDSYAAGPCESGSYYGQAEDYIILVVPPAPSATLLNYAANSSLSTSFAHRRGASSKPKFTISATSAFNAVQFELNHASDFSGTAIVSTIIDGNTYNGSTSYDFWTTQALTANRTYFVRVRLSSNGGSNWGQWTTQLWPYSYYPSTVYADEGWYFTAKEQFITGTVQESTYNFLSIQDNSTSLPDDDYLQVNEGTFSINAGAGDGVYENGDWYPSVSYMTLGWQNDCNGNAAIYNGFPFVVNIPQAATINTADFSVVATSACVCETQNVSMRLIFDAHKVANGSALTSANTTSTVTPARTTANQTFLYNTSWTADTRYTLTSITNILQEIVNQAGWSAGNNFNLMGRWNSSFTPGSNNNRCIRQGDNGASTAPRINGTFTNFKNTIHFPTVNRAVYGPSAAQWNQLTITDNTTGCGTCYTEYRIHDASNNAVVAGPFLRPAGSSGTQSFSIGSVTQQNIYVSATIFRNSSPQIQDIWLTATTPAPLPVELVAFDAKCENETLTFNWTTATERNSDFFTIESSTDGTKWIPEGSLKAAGNSSVQKEYVYLIPESHDENIIYYRLKSTDFDGAFKYSDPISVACKESDINIFPNPNNGTFTITGAFLGDAYTVYNYQGKLVATGEITSVETIVELKDAIDGVYLVKITNNHGEQHRKLIVSN